MRKNFLYLFLIAGFGLMATGCSIGGSSNNTTTTPSTPKVRIWRVNQAIDPFRDSISNFETENKSSGVKVTYSAKTLDDYEVESLRSMASLGGPDIWSIPNDWLGDESPIVLSLPDTYFNDPKTGNVSITDALKKLYPQGISEQIVDNNNKLLGLPTNVDTLQLYINSDLFSLAARIYSDSLGKNPDQTQLNAVNQLLSKPPKTWETLIAQANYLNARDSQGNITRSAIALGSADNVPNSEEILQLLMMQNGAKIISSDRKSASFNDSISSPTGAIIQPGLEALKFYNSFSDKTKANYSWNASMPNAIDAFCDKKVAMVIAFSDFTQKQKVKCPTIYPSVAAVPQVNLSQAPVNFIKFFVETITKTADNQNAALAYLKRYTSKNALDVLAQEQKLSSPNKDSLTIMADNSFKAKQILTGQAIYKKNHTQFDQIFRQMIIDSTINSIPADQALNSANNQINQLFITSNN